MNGAKRWSMVGVIALGFAAGCATNQDADDLELSTGDAVATDPEGKADSTGDQARNDDNEYTIKVTSIVVDAYRNEQSADFNPASPQFWGDGSDDNALKPVPNLCMGPGYSRSCSSWMFLDDIGTTPGVSGRPAFSLTPTDWTFTRTGAELRHGVPFEVLNNAYAKGVMGALTIRLTADQLDSAKSLSGSNGAIQSMRVRVSM